MKYFNFPSDSVLKNTNKLENQKTKVTQNHFDDIKALLNEDQTPYFK